MKLKGGNRGSGSGNREFGIRGERRNPHSAFYNLQSTIYNQQSTINKRAVCLISGGLDSCVTAAIAKKRGYEIYALSFDYGQRHKKELESAKAVAKALRAAGHKTIKLDLRQIGGSALTDSKIGVPERGAEGIGGDIPATYVPARNTIFLSVALGYAEVVGAGAIFIGANDQDYSGYPDCRPEYFGAFRKLARLATKCSVEGRPIKIETPIIHLKKKDIVRKGMELGAPLHLTWSCYKGGKKACGKCDSCLLRLKGFKEAGIKDPVEYE
ncbi:MAG: 7-cyano-7-deazaguanine synthase QueC [Thermoplasmata archaeon HGW-Thermoplasmata-1]|nr:MAG: 7-cyano-7-deazaguanine synthase QueC [Thermoplasmata archaeon HGW-Thermoplasmata-1]